MKIITTFLSLVVFMSVSTAQKKTADIQNQSFRKIINSQWTFNYFPVETADKGYESAGYDDSKWQAISIPHTWNTYETTGELHPFIRSASETDNPYWWTGWGWYRKHFSVNTASAGKKIFIEFEGVQKYCKVWINGTYLGDHKGGYGSFDFDLTRYIKAGADNVIAVAVSNQQNDRYKIPPGNPGNFNVYGGIYRDVTIVLKNNLYIPMQGSASHEGGTFITTPQLSQKEGTVRIRTWVKNDDTQKRNCILQTSILDESKRKVQVIKSSAVINPGQIYMFDQYSKPVTNPHLWSNEDPYLYTVSSDVIDGKDITDTFSSTFGFRWFSWDYKENMLYLNGKKIEVHGGSNYQEYPWLGDASPHWIEAKDITDMAENLNFNFLRTANYPHNKTIYDIADKYGIVVAEESPAKGDQDFSAEVQEQQVKEMIRRDRNHPGIMFWSNSKFALAEDSTRILTQWTAGSSTGFNNINLSIENSAGNAIRGWEKSDIKNPELIELQQCISEENQQKLLMTNVKGNHADRVYEDHGTNGDYINSPINHISPEGIVDVYRIPKYSYYFWQALYARKPLIYIVPHFWTMQYLGQSKDIIVNSNCDKVELKVNGVSKGVLIPDESNSHCVTFKDVTIEKGTLTATGSIKNISVTTRVELTGEPSGIVLSASHKSISADKSSVAIITADIVDMKGNHIYGANNTIKWSVTGPATLIGPSAYSSDMHKHQQSEGVWYIESLVSNLVRSTGKPGKIHIKAQSSGLASGEYDIDAEEIVPDNSIISETMLDDKGRRRAGKTMMTVKRLEDLPPEIRKTNDDIKFDLADRSGYFRDIRGYVCKNNLSVDTSSIEFKTLIELYSTHLINNKGVINADDYNFSTDNFNNCRLIAGYINATKLPPLFKEGLREYYSNSVIRRGDEKNAGDEMNWLNWIPSGGTVVIYSESANSASSKGALITNKNELTDIISLVHPGFIKFSPDAKIRALEFIYKMNPYVQVTTIVEKAASGERITRNLYKAEKDRPVLIPLLKFISE